MTRSLGQSLVEFAAGLAIFALLLIGTLATGGLQETQRRAISGARQAVFAEMWRAGRGADVPEPQVFDSQFNDPGFVRPIGGNRWLEESGLRITSSRQSPPGRASAAGELLLAPLRIAGGFLGSRFDLSPGGFLTSEVAFRLPPSSDLPDPFSRVDLQFSQSMAILGDAWNAADSAQVQTRASGLVPTRSLQSLSGLWQVLATPLSLVEPGIDQLCLGVIDAEALPEDRLGAPVLAPREIGACP